jgi:hypothetical protein
MAKGRVVAIVLAGARAQQRGFPQRVNVRVGKPLIVKIGKPSSSGARLSAFGFAKLSLRGP